MHKSVSTNRSEDDIELILKSLNYDFSKAAKSYTQNFNRLSMQEFRQNWSHSIPTKPSLRYLNKFCKGSRILDIGCGRGLWSALAAKMGIDVVAVDSFEDGLYFADRCLVEPIVSDGIDFVKKNSKSTDTLFLSWPPFWNELSDACLVDFSGNKLVYIGESYGGCTATDEFFEILKNNWTVENRIRLKNFSPISDSITFFCRN